MKIGRFQFPRARSPLESDGIAGQIDRRLKKVKDLRDHVKKLPCPACTKNDALTLVSVELGPKGWEAGILCSNCKTNGVLNQDGMHVNVLTQQEAAKH